MVYQWKPTANFKIDAQTAGDELERIASMREKLTPEVIVDESRPEAAILHPCFDWNDEYGRKIEYVPEISGVDPTTMPGVLTGASYVDRLRQHQCGHF